MYPRGKAIFIRTLRAFGSTPAAIADKYRRGGFTWASPVTLATTNNGSHTTQKLRDQLARDAFAAMRRRGVALFPLWELPNAGNWREHIEDFLDHAESIRAAGVIVNPELSFRGNPEEAQAFATALRHGAASRGMLVGVTSYGHPAGIRDFPLHTFAVFDFAIALTLDRDNDFGEHYFEQALEQYRAAGFSTIYFAAGLWIHDEGRSKTPDEVRRHLAQIPPSPGVVIWPNISIPDDVWNVLTSWSPRLTGAGAPAGAAVVLGFALAGALAIARGS